MDVVTVLQPSEQKANKEQRRTMNIVRRVSVNYIHINRYLYYYTIYSVSFMLATWDHSENKR